MMNIGSVFETVPDIGIILDAYGFILDHNAAASCLGLKKSKNIEKYLKGCLSDGQDKIQINGREYQKKVSPVISHENVIGYTVMLVDITEYTRLISEREEKRGELLKLADELMHRNIELERYALSAKELTDYSEQLAIARKIHDDEGHAITEIHSISEMCLRLIDTDRAQYDKMIQEGIDICRNALKGNRNREYSTLNELFDAFKRVNRFPVEITLNGTEPDFLKDVYPYVDRICKEAYHNTLDHSLADKLFIDVNMSSKAVELRIQDNGKFRGRFEKGFGLSAMEDYVRSTGGTVEFIANEGEGFGIVVTWRRQ